MSGFSDKSREEDYLGNHDDRNRYPELELPGLVMEHQHAGSGAKHAENCGGYENTLGYAPHPALGLQLVSPVKEHDRKVDGKQDNGCCK